MTNRTPEKIRKILNIQKGANSPGKDTPIWITQEQLEELEKNISTLTGTTQESRIKEILGTCRSMGIRLKK